MPKTETRFPHEPAPARLDWVKRDTLSKPMFAYLADTYSAALDRHGPFCAILVAAKTVTEKAVKRGWPVSHAERLGDVAASLYTTILHDTIAEVD